MGANSKIEWTDATWNPVVGCSLVSPGCTNCYAMQMAARIEAMNEGAHKVSMAKDPEWGAIGKSHYAGLTEPAKTGPVWTGNVALAPDHILTAPLRWRKPKRIFVNSMGDLFHESVPDEWIDRVFAVMALAPQHTFRVLTKRSKRMRESASHADTPRRLARALLDMLIAGQIPDGERTITNVTWPLDDDAPDDDPTLRAWPLPNVHVGVSCEDQPRADERIPDLLATPAAVRFVSCEPLLGEVDLTTLCPGHYFIDALSGRKYHDAPEGVNSATEVGARLDWVIVGGESGARARPMHPDWALSIRDQCAAAGVPFFFKQMTKKGMIPDDLMIREFPHVVA
jgi:protein gp37